MFKNSCSDDFGDFRKQNLVLKKSDEVLRQEEENVKRQNTLYLLILKVPVLQKLDIFGGTPGGIILQETMPLTKMLD